VENLPETYDANLRKRSDINSARNSYQVSSATIIRWALRALGNHVERNEGRLVLPLELGDTVVEKAAKKPVKRSTAAARPEAPPVKAAKKRGR
jgi:hypothetical protein